MVRRVPSRVRTSFCQASPCKIKLSRISLWRHQATAVIGASLLAMRGGQQAFPHANIRRQAGSYRGSICLYLWRQACKRIVAGNGHHLMQTFAGRPAPTGERRLVFVETSLQANRGGPQASPHANIRRQAGSYRGSAVLSLWRQACKRIGPVNGHHLMPTFAGRPSTGEA